MHESIRAQIEMTNDMYKKKVNKHKKSAHIQSYDLVWVHLSNEGFPSKRENKLAQRLMDHLNLWEDLRQ